MTEDREMAQLLSEDPNLDKLLDRIVPALEPEAVYLFGSRVKGGADADSDYDLLVVVSDDTPGNKLDPRELYSLSSAAEVAADIVPCSRSGFEAWRDRVGTLSYEAAHFGKLVYGQ